MAVEVDLVVVRGKVDLTTGEVDRGIVRKSTAACWLAAVDL